MDEKLTVRSHRQKRCYPRWAPPALVILLFAFTRCWTSFQQATGPTELRSPYVPHNVTEQVQWDNYSLIIRGQRVFLNSAEFHTWRLPVPALWLDILQKIKAAGFNSISVYTHMGLLNPAPGVFDVEGYRALKPLFDAAMTTGLWVVLRPGPYINAETTAGGLAHWVTSEVAGRLRTNATDFHEAWKPYIEGIIEQTFKYQITEGGPVVAIQIDNEYVQHPAENAEYFAQIEHAYRKLGIVVPLTYNDPHPGKNFVNGTGAVDIYGLDTYPQRFDCSQPLNWNPVVSDYHGYHMDTNPSQPFYIPEAQAGSFDAWGPNAPGYDNCHTLTGADFESVFNLNWWASNAKMINYYMVYGGTSWGYLPFPGVYTSYDYGSAITEERELRTTKYAELKRQNIFLRSSPDFWKTDWVADSMSELGVTVEPSEAAFATHLRNPDTDASFYIVRQHNSSSLATVQFQLHVEDLVLPQVASSIMLRGRQSKVIVTNYAFGGSKLLYSTAPVLFASKIGSRDVIFLYGDFDQDHELSVEFRGKPRPQPQSTFFRTTESPLRGGQTIINVLAGTTAPGGLITIYDSSEQLILFADTDTAGTFWSPTIVEDATTPFSNFWQHGTNSSILVGGPYIVRGAEISGTHLSLQGDLSTSAALTVIAPDTVRSISWNGEPVEALKATLGAQGVISASLETKPHRYTDEIPSLEGWKYSDSLPELADTFDDKNWTTANHQTTHIPYPMHYGDGSILYGCDYGFCEGAVVWRGHFEATGEERYLNLSINGGQAFAASVWVNGVFLKTTYGNSSNNANSIAETDEAYYFPSGSLRPGVDNVVTVLQDNMGLDETEDDDANTSKSPRGIRGFSIDQGTQFTVWKVQGKVGGYKSFPDKTRGIFNEGGLFGERMGWHLPGYNTSSWIDRDLSAGLPGAKAGAGFFVTTFPLHFAPYLDVLLSFTFDDIVQPYRAILFVNGWSMGKRIANLGPQYKFPVPQGILNYDGTNTLCVALWNMEDVQVYPTLNITLGRVYEGGVRSIPTNNPSWSSDGRP